jgi:hypothetical protein
MESSEIPINQQDFGMYASKAAFRLARVIRGRTELSFTSHYAVFPIHKALEWLDETELFIYTSNNSPG